MSEWINIKDQKPLLGIENEVLFVNGKGKVSVGWCFDDTGHSTGQGLAAFNDSIEMDIQFVRYWMPLPKPPISEEK